ncbi:MAG: hypothetical protein K2Y29_00370 [Beijerinckiaceae bacterium]|nr:hypothetical protein [Beijerinckiaceae bacterium]
MAARVKVEFIHLGDGARIDGGAENVIETLVQANDYLAVTTTVTVAGSRPAAPAPTGKGQMYARVTALDNPVIVAWGSNPTASNTSGVRLQADRDELFPVSQGDLLSIMVTT